MVPGAVYIDRVQLDLHTALLNLHTLTAPCTTTRYVSQPQHLFAGVRDLPQMEINDSFEAPTLPLIWSFFQLPLHFLCLLHHQSAQYILNNITIRFATIQEHTKTQGYAVFGATRSLLPLSEVLFCAVDN